VITTNCNPIALLDIEKLGFRVLRERFLEIAERSFVCSVLGLALGVHLGVSYSGVSVHLAYVSCKAYI
jgi:hypothetical protein